MITAEEVKTLILSLLEPSLRGHSLAVSLAQDDTDLRASGLIDSFGFVQLLAQLEQRLGGAIDLSQLDAAQLTKVGPLCGHIAASRSTQ